MNIKDIARLAGVGVSTVSRVINNHPDVKQDTREKIWEIIKEYNYIPNNGARMLKQNHTRYIGDSCDFVFLCQLGVDMRERFIEKKLVDAVKKMGGFAPKFVSPGLDGMPDRIVLFPMGRIAFVELKAPGEKMRPLQVRRKRQLEKLGFSVYCIDGVEQIESILKRIGGDGK